jgi:hypothetical protein
MGVLVASREAWKGKIFLGYWVWKKNCKLEGFFYRFFVLFVGFLDARNH